MLLRPMFDRLDSARGPQQVLRVGMHDLMAFLGAERCNIQLIGRSGDLVVVMQHGLSFAFLDRFRRVSAESTSICGRAARSRSLVFVPEVANDLDFAPHHDAAQCEGITSILSLPLTAPSGEWIGMASAHFAQRASPSRLELASVAQYGDALARKLDRELPEEGKHAFAEALAEELTASLLCSLSARLPLRVESTPS